MLVSNEVCNALMKSYLVMKLCGIYHIFPTFILKCRKSELSRGKTNNVVPQQVRHKPTCTSTEKSWKLEMSDLRRREIVLRSENKGADQLRSYCEADLRLCFHLCRLLIFPRGGSNLNWFVIIPISLLLLICVYKSVIGTVKS